MRSGTACWKNDKQASLRSLRCALLSRARKVGLFELKKMQGIGGRCE